MEHSETNIHSFIIRIWLEETAEETNQTKWRGHITHVPNNLRRHFESLDDIKHFIKPYLQITQVDPE